MEVKHLNNFKNNNNIVQIFIIIILSLQVLLSGIILFRIIKLEDDISKLNIPTNSNINKHVDNISFGNYPALGDSNAKVTVIEFFDYQCPYCLQANNTIKELSNKYPNKIKIYVRDFPLENIHPEAMASALAASCANEQGKFWAFYNALFQKQSQINDESRKSIAKELALDIDKFNSCVKSEKYLVNIQNDIDYGKKIGVTGTPTFFIDGYYVNGNNIEKIENLIETELSK